MKPYMIIEGSSQTIESFEQKVIAALEMGYSLAGDLNTHMVGNGEIKFFQALILEDEAEEDEEDYEEEYEDEDAI